MPFFNESQLIKSDHAPVERLPDAPETMDVIKAAFQQENTLGSFIAGKDIPVGQADPDYNPFDEIEGYEGFASAFAESLNPQDTQRIKDNIDQEMENRRILAESGGRGFVAMAGAGLLDPLSIVSMGIPITKGGTALMTAVKTAGAGVAAATAEEALLHSTQETRTVEESMFAIGASGIVGGLLGGGSAYFRNGANAEELAQITEKVEGDFFHGSTGGAMATASSAEEVALKSVGGLQKGLKQFSPLLRVLDGKSTKAKDAVLNLAESPFFVGKHAQGKGDIAVETLIKRHDAKKAIAIDSVNTAYSNYRKIKDTTTARVVSGFNRGSEKLTLKQFREEVGRAMRRGDSHPIKEVADAAKAVRRDLIEPMKKLLIDEGLLDEGVDVATAPSYLSRVYNRGKIVAERDKWNQILSNYFRKSAQKAGQELDEAEISDLVAKTTDNILGNPRGAPTLDVVPKSKVTKSRVFMISDEEIEDFLESDIQEIADMYMRSTAPEIEITRKFGDRDMRGIIESINDEMNVRVQKAAEAGEDTKAIQDEFAQSVEIVEALRDRLYGKYGSPGSPDRNFSRFSSFMRNLNTVTMLGGMTISAIPDLARPMFSVGFRNYAKGMKLALSRSGALKMSKLEARKMGVGLDMTLGTRFEIIADTMDTYAGRTALERGVNSLSDNVGTITMMNWWNSTIKQWSGAMIADNILTAAQKGADVEQMASLGISKDMAKRIAKQFDEFGETVDDLKLSHSAKWSDLEAREAFEAAVLKDVDVAIVTPGVGDKPLFMSSEAGKLAFQFKSFLFSANNRIFMRGLQQRDAKVLQGGVYSIGLGGVAYMLKQIARGAEISDDPQTLITEAIDYSGILGILPEINNMMGVAGWGPTQLAGAEAPSRFYTRNQLGSFLGPTAGQAENVWRVAYGLAPGTEWNEGDTRAARRLLPYQNLFYIRPALNAGQEMFNEAIGAD